MKLLIRFIFLITFVSCTSVPFNKTKQIQSKLTDTAKNERLTDGLLTDTNLSFDTYCNARFGYCIDYPKQIVYPQPESENGDGRIFKNKSGAEILRVFGRNNFDFEYVSLAQQYNDDLHDTEEKDSNDRVITYQKLSKTFFVISGYNKGKVFYQKTILKDSAFAYAILQYNETDRATFDKVSERIFRSFK